MKYLKIFGLVALVALLGTTAFAWIGQIPSYKGYPQHTLCSTSNWQPVCGINGKTYMNACRAEMNGVYFYSPGMCPTARNAPEFVYVDHSKSKSQKPVVFEVVFV
ncbi:hypothetical protein COY95_02240 [Candidatus Woesearchaeota archaeon CG_4_10_14_0_8_um_filter_47_5]|nr:MAG: hypothetical protein COY95_02240 [Candidatus Woesearchaeota archaeon CG_4_10_14_0_8_um_filter_47_5]